MKWKRNKKGVGIVFLILIIFCNPVQAVGGIRGKTKEGNKHFAEERYDEALQVYRDAQLEDPESPELHYNIGSALYKEKNYEEAIAELERTLSGDDALLQERALYNLGNAHYRQGQLLEAIESYKKALQIDPDDLDAKYNLEFVRNKLKEMAQNQPQDQEQRQEQQQQQQAGGEQKDRQETEQEKRQEAETKEQQETDEEQQRQPPPKREGEMSEEEAERLLNALEEQEKQDQKEQMRREGKGRARVERDW